jgi:hypothetical protein
VFKDGGFDVVVGNPPYLSFGGRQSVEIPNRVREYYSANYESGGWPTAHTVFLERSAKLLSRRFVSFIVPDQVGHLGGYSSMREVLNRDGGIIEVRYWGENVFKKVTTPALTLVVDKARRGGPMNIFDKRGGLATGTIDGGSPWTFSASAALIRRLHANSFSLGDLVGDCGIRTTDAKAQVVALAEAKGKFVPALEGKRIQRYVCEPPEIAVRLDSRKPLHNVGNDTRFRAAVFVIRQTASFPIVAPHEHATFFRNSLHALFAPEDGTHVNYLVALLNSRLMRFVYTETIREAQQRTFPQVKLAALRSLPMRKLDLNDHGDRRRHDTLVQLVDEALKLQRRNLSEKNPLSKESAQRQFEGIDGQIDREVYNLYSLTQEEVDLVEQSIAALDADKPPSWRPETLEPKPEITKSRERRPGLRKVHAEAKKKRAASRT